jgi:L-lactate dehydrogenase (cytochrome)
VRRGSDIVKAVSLGATACSIGRPYLYALGAAGEAGVDQLLDFFESGLTRTMQLCGVNAIDQLTSELVSWKR